ncbi:hypothetical protein [Flagellimonas onchidii]|uniref:hypothetical protein n=1 Tax=Flagellimonas onchidii TaxID=2562684 RepID=UPI0010A6B469|nr:hypothetical protein [Allomuricauda onchidii]
MEKRLLMFFFIFPILASSQDATRKGEFFFNAGPEYRITPIYRLKAFSSKSIYTNPDAQNSGPALNLGVDYYITDNFSIGFKNSFRYDMITSGINVVGSIEPSISKTERDLLVGYHFNLSYQFQIFKKGDLLFRIGISLLNRNSNFTAVESVFDQNGQIVGTVSSLLNYNYSANKISIGYVNGRSKIMLGTYISQNTSYFDETTAFWIPFINYSFDFAKL